jgi:glycosyltransferase involved in cell wall biosynthesis
MPARGARQMGYVQWASSFRNSKKISKLMSIPAISVIMPVYNAECFVADALHSILRQSFSDFECIVINDGSTDGTKKILEDIAISDSRIKLIQHEKRGLVATLNEGLTTARASLIARMDADDISLPDRLHIQWRKMKKEKNIILSGCAVRYMSPDGRLGRKAFFPRSEGISTHLYWGSPFSHPTVIFRRDSVLSVGGYREVFTFCEDYDLWLRIHKLGKMDNIPVILYYYRLHEQSVSRQNIHPQRKNTLITQALWLAEKISGDTGYANISECLPDFHAIPLPSIEQHLLAGRILALYPHLLGDTDDDPESLFLYNMVYQALPHPEAKYALALYHIKCAQFYYSSDKKRTLYHIFVASRYSFLPFKYILIKLLLHKTIPYMHHIVNL